MFSMKLSKRKHHKSNKLKEIWKKAFDVKTDPKTKSMTKFDDCSIKRHAVKKNNEVKPTTRFFSGKMLMFPNISLKSFIYNLIEV